MHYFHQIRRFPFNWETLSGYLASVLIQTVILISIGMQYACTFIITIGFCLISFDFALDLTQNMREFEDTLNLTKYRNWSIPKQIKVSKMLRDIIQFHAQAKELSFI